MAVAQTAIATDRKHTFLHALAFVLGFSAVFVVLGASVAFIGYAINPYLPTFVKIGGVILVVFGLQVIGAWGWVGDRLRGTSAAQSPIGRGFLRFEEGLARLMYTEGRFQVQTDRSLGYLSSALMGVFFSAGWIPCVGPVLASIYLLASDTGTVAQGALLLLVYALGLGLPFLLTGAAFSRMSGWLRKINRHAGIVSKVTGLFLIFIGVLLFTGQLNLISIAFVSRFGTGLASLELGGSSVVTIPIAFAAGVLSFLSPCVLPLIPAYIGYLSGTTVTDSGTPSGEVAAPAGRDVLATRL